EGVRGRELRGVGVPERLSADELGDELGHRVGRERARDTSFDVTPRAVIEKALRGFDGGRGMGDVIGEDLVVVDRTTGRESSDAVADDLLRQFDRARGGREILGCHGCERYAYSR